MSAMATNVSAEQPDRPSDQEILDHIKTIKEEEGITTAPFVSEKISFDSLRQVIHK